MSRFKRGDVVYRKYSKPLMTLNDIDEDGMHECIYFDENGDLKRYYSLEDGLATKDELIIYKRTKKIEKLL